MRIYMKDWQKGLSMETKYNKKLLPTAKSLRNNMTPEERHLWYDFLKGLDVNVKRQQIIGSYIVDFFCASAKLVIELDGTQHYEEKGLEKDAVRDEFLKNCGYTVKRYFNRDIHQNFEGVCRDIYITIYGHDWD